MKALLLLAVGAYLGMWFGNYRHLMAQRREEAIRAGANALILEAENYLKEQQHGCL